MDVDFLGQHLRKYHGKLLIKPSAKSIKALLRKVRAVIKANKSAAAGHLICHLNPIIRGWAMYHRHVVSAQSLPIGGSRHLSSAVALGQTTPSQ